MNQENLKTLINAIKYYIRKNGIGDADPIKSLFECSIIDPLTDENNVIYTDEDNIIFSL